MRVLHLLKTSVGASWALRQMRELVRLGVEVHVAMPMDGPLVPKYMEAGVAIHDISYSVNPLSFWKNIYRLRQIVKEVKPDVVHSHFVLTTLLMRCALRDFMIPRVFQVPGPLHLESAFFRKLELFLAQRQDYWVGSCQWTVDKYIENKVAIDRLGLSYYGTDLHNHQYEPGTLREELGVGSDVSIVAMVAYMYAPKKFLGQKKGLKGHEDFIDAMAPILADRDDVLAVCIGGAWDGAAWYENAIKRYAQKKCGNKMIFLGTRSDVGSLYQDINIVVHPSHSENLGGAAESLLLEVPTITSSVGGFPDIVLDHHTGLLVPPKSPHLLSTAIAQMLDDRVSAYRMAKNGKNHVLKLLDVKDTSKSIFSFYRQVCDV